jgi:hypothetical protein
MWQSDLGQEALQMLEQLKQGYIDEALTNAMGCGSAIEPRIQKAAGVDAAIQMIKLTIK